MNFSEVLIGKNMNAHPDCLGVYIGIDEIYVAQTEKKEGGTVLESLVRVPIHSVDKTLLKPLDLNETFFAMENWVEALTKVASKKKWKTNQVVVSLSPAFCLLRHFVIPANIERKMWKNSIPLQARKYIHFPFEKAEYAYHVYEFETAATKQKRLGVVFAMTTKLIIERLEKGLRSAGLELISVEPSSVSLGRAFNDSDKEAVGNGGRIYSFFGKDMVNFVFLNEHAPVLLREVEISGSLPAERRRFELTNCTEFIAKQLEKDPFEEAVITGVNVDQWVPALEADSKKPVRRWNLSEVYGIEAKSSGEIAAIGASIKFHDHQLPDIDFTKGNRLSDYEFNASWTMWMVVAVALIVFAVLLGNSFWKKYKVANELATARATHKQVLPDFQGLTANQIQSNLSQIKTQNSNFQNMLRSNNSITPVLVDVVNVIPSDMWVNMISYDSKFPGSEKNERSLRLEGSIKTGRDGRADMALGNKFRDDLLEQPTIKEICPKKGNISYTNVAGTSGKSSQSTSNQETKFVFVCSSSAGQSKGGF